MYLKSLEINGFKSFSNKVIIDFNKGITSIVGPNGSGKSNILDAVLWVLGEQSYKSIRAKESTDVIFSGGKNKKPRSSASVSLTIDNSDRYIDFNSNDIVITRTISKDGESTYSLNENKVRLKDIQSLLMDTGIGKQAYSVIGQGKVEKIISSSSQEIRNIIDEAAGIKKAKIEKENSNKRLFNVENEVEKIEYVELELKNRVEELEKESKKARVYVAYTKEINALKYMVYNYYIKKLSSVNKDISDKIEKINKDIQNIENNIINAEKNIEINIKNKENIEAKLKLIFDNDIKNNKELETLKEKQVYYIDKKANFNADLKFKIKEKDILEKKIKDYLDEIKKIKEKIEEFNKKIDEKENLLFQKEDKISEIEKNFLELENKIKNFEEKNKNFEIDKLKIEVYNEDLLKRINQAKNRKKQVELEKKEASIKLENIINFNELSENSEDILKSLEKLLSIKNKLQLKKEELNTKKKVIENNLENYTLLNNAVQYIHKNSIEDKNVFGPFVSMIEVERKYQLAISVIASNSLNDIVVKNFETAKKYINLLKTSKIGTASFLPVENIYTRKLNTEKNNYARNVVKNTSNNKYIDKVIEYIFANTVIVNDMNEGIELAKKYKDKIVTLEGDVISSTGRITGGYIKKRIDETLQKKEEIKNISFEINQVSKKLEEIINNIKNLEDKKDILKEISVYDYEINENILFIEDKEKKVNENFELIKNININISENNKKIIEYREKILKIEDSKELKNNISELNIELAVLKEKKNNTENTYLMKKNEYDIENKEYENINNFILKKDDIFNEIEKKLNDINDKIFNIEKGNTISKNEINMLNKQNLELLDEYKIIIDEKSKLDIDKNTYENNLNNLKNDFERNNIEKEKYLVKFNELFESIEEIKAYSDFKESIDENTLKFYERKININEKSRAELGSVNLSSISEYEKEISRYEILLNEKFDLIKSKESILNLINDINTEIIEKFNDAIYNISKNFEYMCKELLNGAKANIQIQNVNNLLETGLELRVKYKNKPEQSLSLLSGGEKSMLAVSFIMAIFMYKPSPFTFFDEVEAALDEANTRKLVRLLKDFKNSQFILITHNKETMRGSDRLYGVTMNKEIGESILVSVDI